MKEALKLALEALEYWDVHGGLNQPTEEAITALRLAIDVQNMASESTYKAALEQKQEPVAWLYERARFGPTDLRGQQWRLELSRLKPWAGNGLVRNIQPLYTSPPQRQPIEPVAYPENFIDALRYNTALREFEPEKAQKQEPAWYHAECDDPDHSGFFKEAIDAVMQVNEHGGFVTQLYTSPPQRQPLTDEQIAKCYETTGHYQTLRPQDRFAVFALARAIEAAHGIKGEAT